MFEAGSEMPALESEAKARTKSLFDEVFRDYAALSDVKNKPKKKKPQEEQIALDILKNQPGTSKNRENETLKSEYDADKESPRVRQKSRDKVPEDETSNVGLKEQKKTKTKKKNKKVMGAEWINSDEPLIDNSKSVQQTEKKTRIKSDREQSTISKKKGGGDMKDQSDLNDFDDDSLIEAYHLKVSQQEADEIKEKMKKKLRAHLSELSVSSEGHTLLLNNDTPVKKKKKKDRIATQEPEIRASDELQGQPTELYASTVHSQVSQGTYDDKVQDLPKSTKKTKKKPKADDSTKNTPDVRKERENDSTHVYDDSLVLGVYIHRSDKLKTDLTVSRPTVKIHIFDQKTGEYAKKENRTQLDSSFNEQDKLKYIFPLTTQAYDFKRFKSPVPEWDEQIIFNERFTYFLEENEESPKVIIFFEIVDTYNENGAGTSSELETQEKGAQKIAWAFLKLVGTNRVFNVDSRLRLQLYYPPSRSRLISSTSVFDWWLKYPRNPYPSTLYVTIKGLQLPDNMNPSFGSSKHIQRDLGSNVPDLNNDINLRGTESSESKPKKEPFQWTRLPGQACRIPNRPLLSLHAGHMGCFTISFSNDGRILAAACACRDGFPVYLYDIPSGQYLRELHGHLNVVYDLCWSKDDQHLLSSSSDSTVRLWKTGSESLSALKVLPHPSFVYAAKFHPMANALVVTGCYDGVIRVWNVKMKEVNGQLLQEFNVHKSFINTLCFDSEGIHMYTGDGSGLINIWSAGISRSSRQNSLEHWGILKEIRDTDLKGVPVNHLEVHPNGRRLLVHAKDSTLRVMDLRILAAKKYIGATNYREKIHSSFTPCGTFVFAGSEDGIVYVWNTETGDQVAKYSELSYTAPIRDVAFHPHENMVAFCAFGQNQPILVYIYDYKVAQMEAEAVQVSSNLGTSSNSENITQQELYISAADRFANVARTSMKMMKVKQKLDSVLNGSSALLPAHSLLSPHSKLRLSGTPSTHLITQPFDNSQHGGFSPVGQSLSRAPSIRLQMNNTDATISSLKIEADVKPSIKESAVALYDYTAHRSDELTIHRSDIIHVLYKDNDNWWFGSLANGQQGYFPANYVATEFQHEDLPSKSTTNSFALQKEKLESEEGLKSRYMMLATPSKSKDLEIMSHHDTDANSPVTHAQKIQNLLELPHKSSNMILTQSEETIPASSERSELASPSQETYRKIKKKKNSKHIITSVVGKTNRAFEPDV
ncbi:jouberin isoform X1 [Pelobates cultripes]|uniref:Jouberin n=1 Tax=Pelobates cultripes TaxID=61616 RepID=A0AAD1RE89_PELCU|nr:jouberin isoform X1 [Pelobates cultripes]